MLTLWIRKAPRLTVAVVPYSEDWKTTALVLVVPVESHRQGCCCVVAEILQIAGIQMLERPSRASSKT